MESKKREKYFKLKSVRDELTTRVQRIDQELEREEADLSPHDQSKNNGTACTYNVKEASQSAKKVLGKKVNREEEDFIDDLRSRNNLLQKENKSLHGKLKNASIVVKKYKNEVQALKRRYSRVGRGRLQKDSIKQGGKRSGCKVGIDMNNYDDDGFEDDSDSDDTCHRHSKGNSNENNTLSKVQGRLQELENEMEALRKEKDHLKASKAEVEKNYQCMAENRDEGIDQVYTLKKQLQETTQNLRTMSVQYKSLEAKAQLQLEVQKETRKKLEQCNSYILKLQNELEMLRLEQEKASQNARKVEEQKEQVQDLVEENRLLQDNLSKLCELPFIQDEASVSVEPSLLLEEQIAELEVKNDQYREQIKEFIRNKNGYEETTTLIRDKMERWKTRCEEIESELQVFKLNKPHNHDESTQTKELKTPERRDTYTQTDELELQVDQRNDQTAMGEKSIKTQESPIKTQESSINEKNRTNTNDFGSKERMVETINTEPNSNVSYTYVSPLSLDGPLFVGNKLETIDMEEESKNNSDLHLKNASTHATSETLAYFQRGDDVNYIDFLRFVDPPYPILKQIELLHLMKDGLKQYFFTRNNSSVVNNTNTEEEQIAEEEFIEAVALLSNDDNEIIQLNEIQDLYRHIANDGVERVTLQRMLHFLYSPEINNIRDLFFSFRKSSINPWGPFKVADTHRTGYVSKCTFNECLRSVGIQSLAIL